MGLMIALVPQRCRKAAPAKLTASRTAGAYLRAACGDFSSRPPLLLSLELAACKTLGSNPPEPEQSLDRKKKGETGAHVAQSRDDGRCTARARRAISARRHAAAQERKSPSCTPGRRRRSPVRRAAIRCRVGPQAREPGARASGSRPWYWLRKKPTFSTPRNCKGWHARRGRAARS